MMYHCTKIRILLENISTTKLIHSIYIKPTQKFQITDNANYLVILIKDNLNLRHIYNCYDVSTLMILKYSNKCVRCIGKNDMIFRQYSKIVEIIKEDSEKNFSAFHTDK